jgi:hypothetical protein
MSYRLKIFDAEASPEQLRAAEQRFRQALEAVLGSDALVLPVHAAYQRIVLTYGEDPDRELLSESERVILDQWREAETAAVTATFGEHRYMGDAMYEIGP